MDAVDVMKLFVELRCFINGPIVAIINKPN